MIIDFKGLLYNTPNKSTIKINANAPKSGDQLIDKDNNTFFI